MGMPAYDFGLCSFPLLNDCQRKHLKTIDFVREIIYNISVAFTTVFNVNSWQ